MKALRKKKELEDMLITHKLSKEQEKDKTGRESVAKEAKEVKATKEFEQMKKRLALTGDQKEREFILEMIQKRYGNETAEKIISELRLLKDEGGSILEEEATSTSIKTKE